MKLIIQNFYKNQVIADNKINYDIILELDRKINNKLQNLKNNILNNNNKKKSKLKDAFKILNSSYKIYKYYKKILKNNCKKFNLNDIISNNLLEDYFNMGWEALTKNYIQKVGKEIDINSLNNDSFVSLNQTEKKLTLEMLGSIRKYFIENMFNCTGKTEYNKYMAFGSSNITSDYDVTILGPDSNDIMIDMFLKFLKHYKNTLPYAFDSNLYVSPLYIKIKNDDKNEYTVPAIQDGRLIEISENVNLEANKYYIWSYGNNNQEFTLIPTSFEDIKQELIFSALRLTDYNNEDEDEDEDEDKKWIIQLNDKINIIDEAVKLKQELDKKFNSLKEKIKEMTKEKYKQDTIEIITEIITKYALQYRSQKVCQNFIYNKDYSQLKENLFKLSNTVNYYSSDAYYTSCAVNSVVLEIQRNLNFKYNDKYTNLRHIISCIENIGMLLEHLKEAESKKKTKSEETKEAKSEETTLKKTTSEETTLEETKKTKSEETTSEKQKKQNQKKQNQFLLIF